MAENNKKAYLLTDAYGFGCLSIKPHAIFLTNSMKEAVEFLGGFDDRWDYPNQSVRFKVKTDNLTNLGISSLMPLKNECQPGVSVLEIRELPFFTKETAISAK